MYPGTVPAAGGIKKYSVSMGIVVAGYGFPGYVPDINPGTWYGHDVFRLVSVLQCGLPAGIIKCDLCCECESNNW